MTWAFLCAIKTVKPRFTCITSTIIRTRFADRFTSSIAVRTIIPSVTFTTLPRMLGTVRLTAVVRAPLVAMIPPPAMVAVKTCADVKLTQTTVFIVALLTTRFPTVPILTRLAGSVYLVTGRKPAVFRTCFVAKWSPKARIATPISAVSCKPFTPITAIWGRTRQVACFPVESFVTFITVSGYLASDHTVFIAPELAPVTVMAVMTGHTNTAIFITVQTLEAVLVTTRSKVAMGTLP